MTRGSIHGNNNDDDDGDVDDDDNDDDHNNNQALIEYNHVLANILRSLFVARSPSEEARSPGRRSNVENAPRRRPLIGQPATSTSHIRRAIFITPQPPASHRPAARADPAERSHYVVISRDGRKLVTRVWVMLP